MGDALLDGSDGEEQFATMLAEKVSRAWLLRCAAVMNTVCVLVHVCEQMMADHARSAGGIDFDPDDDFNPFSEDEVGAHVHESAK